MKKAILSILISTFVSYGYAQNLVSNGDFEITAPGYCTRPYDATYCGMFELATGWFNAASCVGGSSTDHICNPNNSALWNLPLTPPSGAGVMGVASGLAVNEFTEAFTTTLSSSQPSGTVINVSMQVSPRTNALSSGSPVDAGILFGVYFYNGGAVPEVLTGSFGVGHHLSATPQMVIDPTGWTMDAWHAVSQNYTLTATTSQIAIGFFNPGGNVSNGGRYFAIDDVVVTIASPCGACPSGGSGVNWTWTGCQDTDWFNPCNWDRQAVPNATSVVTIPNTTNKPLINSGTADCFNITIQSSTGARLDINSAGGGVLNVTQ